MADAYSGQSPTPRMRHRTRKYDLNERATAHTAQPVDTASCDGSTDAIVDSDGSADEFSARMRVLVEEVAPGRGKFGQLERMSGYSKDSWKGAWYGKQRYVSEMIQFICKLRPNDARWLLTGGERWGQEAGHPLSSAARFAREHLKECAAEVLGQRRYGFVHPAGKLKQLSAICETAGYTDSVAQAVDCVIALALEAASE